MQRQCLESDENTEHILKHLNQTKFPFREGFSRYFLKEIVTLFRYC